MDQYAAVLQGSTAVISAASARGLVPVEARELPWLPSGVLPESLRPAFRATALDWSISLAEEEIEVARGPDAVVRLAELSTAIGGDGVARTQASYSIENRSLQFLIVEMPEGSSLWGVSLGGKPIAVGEDGMTGGRRRLRVPLEHVGAASLELEVSIRYEERPLSLPSIRGNAFLSAPRILGPQTVQTIWNVDFPREYSVSAAGGNMREVAGSARSARKIENLLEQLEKVSKASAADSARVRAKAERELRRLEQALGDSAAELDERSRGAAEEARASEIGRDVLERQWADNKALMEKTRKAQLGLREARQAREGQAVQQAEGAPQPVEQQPQQQQLQQQRSKAEQAFEDTTNYMKRSWSKNEAPVPPSREGQTQEVRQDAGAAGVQALLEGEPFRGLAGAPTAPMAPAADAAAAKPLDGLRALKPLDDRIAGAAAPGLEAPPTPAGGAAYTFVHAGGDAELTLGWTRRDLAPRAVASALLAAAAAAAIWLGRRRRA